MEQTNSWILCFQNDRNIIRYITSELSFPAILNYYKFLEYIQQFNIQNFDDFKNCLNKFETILINPSTGSWEIYHKQETKKPTFDELWKMNATDEAKRERQEALHPDQNKTIIENSKDWIDEFVTDKNRSELEKKVKMSTKFQRGNINGGNRRELFRRDYFWKR